ncbi:EamA family transporter [Metallumcola ferriviriculae]|uniref:EamA family transporter n=1 Tax=Metallumcola ferriviriculae TaxID=3039180 RepID=A0AAU0URE7_9FIRM|nr:EamA family transporter [Desulfitibacteraceae bacterium MK1]
MTKQKSTFTIVSMLLIYVIWGATFSVMKVGIEYIPPLTFSSLRFIIGGALLVLFGIVVRTPFPAKEDWGALAILGLFQTTFTFSLVFYAMQFVEAGLTAILMYTYPLLVNLMAHFLLPGERLNTRKVIGLLVGFSGLILIFAANANTAGGWGTVGKVLILFAALSWAGATIYLRRRFQNHNTLQVTAWQMLLGGVFTIVPAFLFERTASFNFNLIAWETLLFASILASALAFALWFYVLDRLGVGRASVFLFLVPVCGVVFATFLLKEPFTLRVLGGMLSVAAGIWLVNAGGGQELGQPVMTPYDSAKSLE